MSDCLRTHHLFNTKLEFGTRLNSEIDLEKNPLVAYWTKRSSSLNQYISILKCLLYLMLTILRHMVQGFECKDIGTGGFNCFDNPCENNKFRRYMLNKSYSKKEACDGITSSKDSPERHSKTDSAKKALMYHSNVEPVGSSFLNDFNISADSNGQVLPANSNKSHEYFKAQERRVQPSLDQSSSSISVKHNAEIKHVSEVEQTGLGNMSNNSSIEIHDEEPHSKSSSSISIMSIYKNEALNQIEGSDETGLDLYSLPSADLDCLGNTSLEMDDSFGWQETDDSVASIRANESLENKLKEIFMSTYKNEAVNHGAHQTEGSEETRLDLGSLRNAHCDRLGNALPETDDTFCWQETDDTLTSLRVNDNLENKLKEIFQPTNLANKYGTVFFQCADTLSNSDNPVQHNSLTHIEKDISEQELMQVNAALAGSFLARDGNFGELLNHESVPKKVQRPDDADSRCLNLPRGTFNDHSDGSRKQYLESGNTSNVFDDLCDTNFDVGTNHYCADKTPISTSEFVCLENTNIMHDAMQLKEEQNFLCNPKIMDEHNVGLGVVSLKGILVETYQAEAVGAEDKPQDVVSGAETAETTEVEDAAGAQGEDVGDNDTEGENQEGEGGDGEGGGESGGEGGQEETKTDEGNDYILILMRGALGPSFDEAVIDMMDVIKRIVEFIKELVKGSFLQEGEGSSSEGDTGGGETGDESGQEDAAATGGEEGGAEGGEQGGAEAAGGEEQGGAVAAGGEEQGGAEAEEQGGAEAAEGEEQGDTEAAEGEEQGGAEGGEEGGEAGGEEEGAQDAEQGGEAGTKEGAAEGGAEEDVESAEPETKESDEESIEVIADDVDNQPEEQLQSEDNEDPPEEEEKEVANENLQE